MLVVLLGLGGLLATYLRDRAFERIDEVVDLGYRGAAASDPYLALERLFQAMDLPTQKVSSLVRLPPTDHVLWLLTSRRRTKSSRLVDWVEAGGHLVVLPVGGPGEDPLLEALGFELFETDDPEQLAIEIPTDFLSQRPPWPRVYLNRGNPRVLRSEGGGGAYWWATIELGKGKATALNDGSFLQNEALGVQDHALLAWTIAAADEAPAGLWIAVRDPRPSVWVLLSASGWPIAVSLATLIIATWWTASKRFGPLLEDPVREHRQLAEHLQASGRYLWKIGCEDTLLRATRQALARRLGRGRPVDGDNLEVTALQVPAAQELGESQVLEALRVLEVRDRFRFVRCIRVLETLRRSI